MQSRLSPHTNLIRKLRTYIRNFRLYIRNLRMYIRNLRIYFTHRAMPVYIPPSQGLHPTLRMPASDNRQTQAARHTSPHPHDRDATMGMAIKKSAPFHETGRSAVSGQYGECQPKLSNIRFDIGTPRLSSICSTARDIGPGPHI